MVIKMKKIDYNNYKNEVMSTKGLLLVKYSATWCVYCKKSLKRDQDLFSNLDDFSVIEVDMAGVDDELGWQITQVEVVPSYRIYKDGQVLAFLSGPQSKDSILDAINSHN